MTTISDTAAQLANVQDLRSKRDDWRSGLQTSDRGKPEGSAVNIAHCMEHAPELAGMIGFDEFEQLTVLVSPPPWQQGEFQQRQWTDADDTELLLWLQFNGLPVRGVTAVADTARMVARRHAFDPLADYLNGIEWDGSHRLEAWLTTYLGADPTPLNRAIARAFLISAVARGLRPGCQADHVLCLESPQGAGKTETVRTIGGQWTQENLPDMHSKDGIAALAGAWFVELSELAAMSRSEVESVKSFISRRVDKYRPAYGRHAIEQPRRCVFVATTNEGHYLRDRTGNRRFWPVKCTTIDLDALREDRDQLFAEAVHCYRQGEAWHFTDQDVIRAAQAEQLARVEHDPWAADIAAFIADKSSVTTSEILIMLDVPRGRTSAPHAKRIAGIMREIGWASREDKSGGSREIVWSASDE